MPLPLRLPPLGWNSQCTDGPGKARGQKRFLFYTNAESRKGLELESNPRAALCFHWKTLRRQVRVEGPVSGMEAADVDAYFHSRSRDSQIGAAVFQQSRPLRSQEELETQFRKFSQEHPGEVPRPPYWRGFCLQAEQIEFWISGENRLHTRFLSPATQVPGREPACFRNRREYRRP